jgi:formylglycine-generating enzyme required for sulfatase activity
MICLDPEGAAGYIVVMKMDFHIKLLIALLLIFGVVISIFIVYEPVRVRILAWKLESSDKSVREDAISDLLKSGERGSVVLISYFKNRYPNADVDERIKIVETMCGMGDEARAALRVMFIMRCKREMVSIPAGEFMMGSENGAGDEKPVHKVTMSAFAMDKYEVTNEKYYVFVKCASYRAPKNWESGKIPEGLEQHPVVCVSWEDSDAYAEWLRMRLTTEAEWEYACRADSTGEYCFGDNEGELGEYAWSYKNSNNQTHPVGEKKPNKWRLFDMHGNVWEWCSDWYDVNYYLTSPLNNPQGPSSGTSRVLRGGGWDYDATNCRAAARGWVNPGVRGGSIGFRLARSCSGQ